MDSMHPTILFEPASTRSDTAESSGGVSKAKVGFLAGRRPRFDDETGKLLRSHLAAATLILLLVLAAAFLGNLLAGIDTLRWLRASVLLVLCGCLAALRSRFSFDLTHLRYLELAIFTLLAFQLSLIFIVRINVFTAIEDASSVVAVQHIFLAAWCILSLVYGIFIPNSWRRAAMVLIPAALVPYLIIWAQQSYAPHVAALLKQDQSATPIPLPLVAAVFGIYSAHVLNSARREAFKARQFGQYHLMERLGGGGMGEVYKAEHVLLKRPCAIKLIRPEGKADTVIAKFEKEVKTTASLTHWNTVEVYDYGYTEDGTFYYVMELLPGMSFQDLVQKHGPLPAERVVYLLRQVCGALQEAHRVGMIHRDIKPANIFAAERGGVFDVAKLLDFGLVKEISADQNEGAKDGAFSGTPLYMPPEQASAYEEVDARADIYSLGAVAYYLLTGQPPFSSPTVLGLLEAHARSEVVPPARISPQTPPDLEEVILKCLAKEAADRFQDAAHLEEALTRCECAALWTPKQAAEWWRALTSEGRSTSNPIRLEEQHVHKELSNQMRLLH